MDYIPKRSDHIQWGRLPSGQVQLVKPRDGWLDRLVRKITHTPERYLVDLDALGSFVWQEIDGQKTVFEISQAVRAAFQDEAEPLLDRLVTYLTILKNNDFIQLNKPISR